RKRINQEAATLDECQCLFRHANTSGVVKTCITSPGGLWTRLSVCNLSCYPPNSGIERLRQIFFTS
ncbi:MAG: hypothetical protein ACRD2L_08775, partial [Terriglobia bacterium]